MLARAEFTVRPRLPVESMGTCTCYVSHDRITVGDNDTGSPAFGVDSRWSVLVCGMGTRNKYMSPDDTTDSHKCVGEIWEYWSASPYAANATNAWNVNFNNGNDNANNKSNNNYVRLVRGGEWIKSPLQYSGRMSGNPTSSSFSGWGEVHGCSMHRDFNLEMGRSGEGNRRS